MNILRVLVFTFFMSGIVFLCGFDLGAGKRSEDLLTSPSDIIKGNFTFASVMRNFSECKKETKTLSFETVYSSRFIKIFPKLDTI